MFYENPGGIYNINYVRIRDGANGYFKLPSLTTTQRDALSPVANGYMIYNSTTSQVEAYEGGAWSGAAGDVSGPGSSTDNAIARFDGTGGKTIQNSVVTIADTTGNMTGVGTLTLGDVLTFSDGATIDNSDATTLQLTETTIDLVGATLADALTLSDVLTFSDGATIDNTDASTLTITETNIIAAGVTSLLGSSAVIGFDAGAAMTLTTSDTTGVLAITHAGSGVTVTWTAPSFDFVGAMAADALTLSDVLTFSDGATIDNTDADTLTITETNIALTGIVGITGATNIVGAVTVGVDETGHDVKFFGATTGAYLLFDESEDALVLQGGATKQMEIRFMEDTDNGAHYAALKASASMAAAITWILPAADSTGTQYLRSDGSGNLSFATIAGGGDVLADGSVPFTASVFIEEIAAAAADVAGSGQVWVKNDAPCTLWFTDDAGADTEITSAIHDNVAGEIVAIAEKTAPISADEFLIEDSADSNNKKSLKFSNTPLSILKNTVTTKTGTATLTIAEAGVVLVSAAGAYTLTLPTASGNAGLTYRFIKTDANYNLITLDGNGAETFNFENSTGAPVATYTRLNTYCAEVTVVSDGTNWQCINEQTGLMPSMLAYINANQNDLTHQTNVTVELNTEVYDIGSNFNTGTYTFTAPIAGKYLAMAKVAFVAASVVAGEHASLIIGSVAGYLAYAWTQMPTAGKDGACVASNVVSLAANETVTLAAHIGHASADTMDIYGNAQGDTYLSILMLSKN